MIYDDFPEIENIETGMIEDTYRPSYGLQEKLNTNSVIIQFGNGYMQIVPIGKNYSSFEYQVSWDNRRYNFTDDINNKEEGNIIYDFLVEHQEAKPFWFRKLPNETKKLVYASEVQLTHSVFDLVNISCILKQFKGFEDTSTLGDIINANR